MARTTPTTFAFLGGDCCHFPGSFRPTPYIPLPPQLPSLQLGLYPYYPSLCPCSHFTQQHPFSDKNRSSNAIDPRIRPFYSVSTANSSAYTSPDQARASIHRLQELDAYPEILICLAHAGGLSDILPLWNQDPAKDINDWYAKGFKAQLHWRFLNELPKDDRPGRSALIPIPSDRA